jgi:cyclophilin family peptidyl-prolyl cis-trans isomerase
MKRIAVLLISFLFVASGLFAGQETKPETSAKDTTKAEKKMYKKRQADNPEIAVETDFGTMKLELFRDAAPIHVDSMLSRIREGFYDGLIFHRIIDGFMIQGGDPKGNGTGGPGYTLPAEFNKIKHVEGTLSMARGPAPNTAGSQFFICLANTPYLDGKYTNFGHLMEGYDVLHKIGKVDTDSRDKPLKDVFIRKMTIIKDIPKKESK